MYVCVCVYICVCACVCERERNQYCVENITYLCFSITDNWCATYECFS